MSESSPAPVSASAGPSEAWVVARPRLRDVLLLNLRAIKGRAYVRVIGANREPSWLISETLLPLIAVSAYVFVYRGLGGDPSYSAFVLLGGVMTAYWMAVVWSMALQFYWEKEMGNLNIYLMAPISRMSILLGMAFGGVYMTSVRAVVILVCGSLLFGVEFPVTSWPWLIVSFLLTLSSLYALGMALSSLFMVYGRGGWRSAEILQEPVYLLSGFYFPLSKLGQVVAMGASFLPMAIGLDAVRQFAVPGTGGIGVLSARVEVALLFFLTILFVVAARRALAYMEDLGKREGRLTVRWQ